MIFGEVKAPGCEDCVVEGGRAYCTMNCSPRESVRSATGQGHLSLFPHREGWPQQREIVLRILEDFMSQEDQDGPFGSYRIMSASFGFDPKGARLFRFTYEVAG